MVILYGLTFTDHTGPLPIHAGLDLLRDLLGMFPAQSNIVYPTLSLGPDSSWENQVTLAPTLLVGFVDG